MKTIIIALITVFILLPSIYSQKNSDYYKQPPVIEGSNLIIYGEPYYSYSKSPIDSGISRTEYNLSLHANYQKYRFTDDLNYYTNAGLSARHSEYSSGIIISDDMSGSESSTIKETQFYFNSQAGISWYIPKTKIFTGLFNSNIFLFINRYKPYISTFIDINAGYGRITDANVINGTEYIEEVLTDEALINKRLEQGVRQKINILLDKRRQREFYYKYKDDEDIEFFAQLEKLLLDNKIITKPLNARTTMLIYRTLADNRYNRYPVYKGWQAAADLSSKYLNLLDDTTEYAKDLTLSAFYGLPLSNSTSLLFSTAFSLPVNKGYNFPDLDAEIYTPLIIRSFAQSYYSNNYLNPGYGYYYNSQRKFYDYKTYFQAFLFHNFNSTAGLLTRFYLSAGKLRDQNSYLTLYSAEISLRYYILNRLMLNSGFNFNGYGKSYRYFTVRTSIGYTFF